MPRRALQLPFHGSWFVFWGGDTVELNYHYVDRAAKYALDMIILDKKGNSYSGTGTKNTDYYAFGQDILVAADGVVVEAIDGMLDNVPQKTTNNYMYNGNSVMIKHAENFYSLTCHLRQGSVIVNAGQQVKAGQKLGECGNSGNSSEPHLHFQLQDNAVFTAFGSNYKRKPIAKGLKPFFKLALQRASKTIVKNYYSPIKGDTVSPIK